tara:strand:- start:5617 stop:8745 length:3129 start_codon:yes stop_codon:yes gene_type:complete
MTNFNIYKASAGSGKTYTLVKEYLLRCLSSNDLICHQSLLAITFTNKAAAEMKTRIISTLFDFTKGIDFIEDNVNKNLFNEIKEILDYNEPFLVQKSKKVLSGIIHYYGLFSVSTIDKFIHRIIRKFTYELDLSNTFEVEMDNEKIITEAVSSVIDEIGTNKELTQTLLQYSLYKIKEDKSWDIEDDLKKISEQLFKDYNSEFINNVPDINLIKKIKIQLLNFINDFESSFKLSVANINKLILQIPYEVFPYKDLPNYMNKVSTPPYLDVIMSNRLADSIKNKKWYKSGAENDYKNKLDTISQELYEKLSNLIELIDKDHPTYLLSKQSYSSLFAVSVLSNISTKIKDIKNNNNLVHISEFNQIINSFLEKNPTPFIYEKIGNRYNSYFIDEFQDTSVIQWSNLSPLIEEALSSGGSCLIVGDAKQSIYRWRGGEVKQFLSLSEFNQKHHLNQFKSKIHSLNINYRSDKEIVSFNNNFFKFLSQYLDSPYDRLYSNLNHKCNSTNLGKVSVSGLNVKGENVLVNTMNLIYNKIIDVVNNGYSYSDICILTRSNKEISSIATFLTKMQIPIISSESLLLKNSNTVQFIINNLQVILDPKNYLSKANILEYLISNNLIQSKTESAHSLLYKHSKIDNYQFKSFLNLSSINWDYKRYRRLNLYELTEEIIRTFSLDMSSNMYMNFFLDFIYEFATKKSNSIHEFLRFWDEKKHSASITIPSGINAIELMTIHKSKGLQFPIVIFPFANWKEDLGKDKNWFNIGSVFESKFPFKDIITLLPIKKELERWPQPFPTIYAEHKNQTKLDSINLLYVAMTRPKNELHIITNSDPKKGSIYKYFEKYLAHGDNLRFVSDISDSLEETSKTLICDQNTQISDSNFISCSWRSRMRIRKKRGYSKVLKTKLAINWGELIHQIMAGINLKSDVNKMLNTYNVLEHYGEDAFERIKSSIEKIILDSRISDLFSNEFNHFIERDIVDPKGSIYRPDRVVVQSDTKVAIIDYKTGKEKPEDVKQIKKYESVLLNMGYKHISKFLIYLSKDKIQEVR